VFAKVLVANRGEIALRIFRTLRDMNIASVAVYSDVDRTAVHTLYADEALALGGSTSAETYLVVPKLLEAAERSGAEAVHPGYGFLAENAAFARAVEEAGLVWIGPPPAAIELMGSKTRARQTMQAAGVPIIPGTTDPVGSAAEVVALGEEIGWPLLIKAAAGGGGKGMKVVRGADDAVQAFESAQREGQAYFADASVYVERYLEDPRHVEVQVLADSFGNVIHLGERDCSMQRRHQKVIEEAPAPGITARQRRIMGDLCVEACKAVGYRSAGTLEFLYQDGEFYFIEMNTRIQVEHPVTELITGIDLVKAQLLIASGDPMSYQQSDVQIRGHAIECRINAEDPKTFMPSPGPIRLWHAPGGPGVRIDSHIYSGYNVPPNYDSLIGKLITYGDTRETALARMKNALAEMVIEGIKTNVALHQEIFNHGAFQKGGTDIHYLERRLGLR
jgi:acetyl-CoA carboxylase, biotin carboxylase subunit